MATKIEDFLKEKKIDPRRILVASAELERLRLEDRQNPARQAGSPEERGPGEEEGGARRARSPAAVAR